MDLEKILILNEIKDYEIQLSNFAYPYISNVNEIRDFLINNEALYQRAINYCIAEFDDGKGMLEPLTYADLSGRYKKEIEFIDRYKYMKRIVDLQELESFYIDEVEEFDTISNSVKKVKKWLDKVAVYFEQEELIAINWHTTNYINIPQNDIVIYFWDDIHIFIRREDFKGALQLSSLFWDLLWNLEIYPENEFYIKFNQ